MKVGVSHDNQKQLGISLNFLSNTSQLTCYENNSDKTELLVTELSLLNSDVSGRVCRIACKLKWVVKYFADVVIKILEE